MFFLAVKWLALRAGAPAARICVLSFGQMALRSARARGRAGFFFKMVLALVARGCFFSFGQVACAPRGPEAGRGVSTPPSLPLDSTLPATS